MRLAETVRKVSLTVLSVVLLSPGCEHASSPTAPPSSTPRPAPTLTPTPSPTAIPCADLAGGYDLRVTVDQCVVVPVPFGTPVDQTGCTFHFPLRFDSGSVLGQIRGGVIDFTWFNYGCSPDLVGTGTFAPAGAGSPGRHLISGSVSGPAVGESPYGPCCTRIDFTLEPR